MQEDEFCGTWGETNNAHKALAEPSELRHNVGELDIMGC
jgi:hypothetical protein